MFEQLHRRDDTCLERRSDDNALSSTSLADRDVTTTMRATLDLPRRVATRGNPKAIARPIGHANSIRTTRHGNERCDVIAISNIQIICIY